MSHILTVDAAPKILPEISGKSDGQWWNINSMPISLFTLEEEEEEEEEKKMLPDQWQEVAKWEGRNS